MVEVSEGRGAHEPEKEEHDHVHDREPAKMEHFEDKAGLARKRAEAYTQTFIFRTVRGPKSL